MAKTPKETAPKPSIPNPELKEFRAAKPSKRLEMIYVLLLKLTAK